MNYISRIALGVAALMSVLTLSAQTQISDRVILDDEALAAGGNSWALTGQDCGTATAVINCAALIPRANTGGFFPNVRISFDPTTGQGAFEFETFQRVENANGPYLDRGPISHAVATWETVTLPNGVQSQQISRMVLYGWGSYAPASGIAQCNGPNPDYQTFPSNCWVIKPLTVNFSYRAVFHQGGTYTLDRVVVNGELTFAQIQ